MQIEFLGAHNTEVLSAKPTAILVDRVLALDAGGLAHALSLQDQLRLQVVLLTHHHLDHIKDIPFIAMNIAHQSCLEVVSSRETLAILAGHLLDGTLYPDFRTWPEEMPALKLTEIAPALPTTIAGHEVLAVPVKHNIPAQGYQIAGKERGRSLFYTGDTGPGLSASWQGISPDLLITEVSMPNRMEKWAREVCHLTPRLLREELHAFRQQKGYLPPVYIVHLNVQVEDEVAQEIAAVAAELDAQIRLASEGMGVNI